MIHSKYLLAILIPFLVTTARGVAQQVTSVAFSGREGVHTPHSGRNAIILSDSLSHLRKPVPIVSYPHPAAPLVTNAFHPDSSTKPVSSSVASSPVSIRHVDTLNVFASDQASSDTSLSSQPATSGESPSENLPPGALDTTTISFKNTDLRDIFRGLAYQHGLNIFVQNSIDKHVTISLNEVPVYYAIKFLCKQNDLDLTLKGGIFEITIPPPPKIVPPPKPKAYVAYDDGDLWIATNNVSLRSVVQAIRNKSDKNILITEGTSGPVTGQLNNINFDIGFTQLMNNNGFAVGKRDGIYIVSRLQYYVGGKGKNGPPAASGPYWISAKDSLVTIDVTNAPIQRVISDLVHQTNSDAIFYNDVPGDITARVSNVSLTDALNLLLMNTTDTYRISGGKYFIGNRSDKTMTSVKLVKLRYMRPKDLIKMIPKYITSEATIKPVPEENAVVIMASNDVISQFEHLVRDIDKPVPQVLIEALVVDYNLTRSSQLGVSAGIQNAPDTSVQNYTIIPGINYTTTGLRINADLKQIGTINVFGTSLGVANLGVLPANFYLNLQALEEKGIADVRSRPLLATLNGHEATLSIGTTQYYELSTTIPYNGQNNTTVFQQSQTFQKIEADVKLEITPYVGANGMIFVDIKPDFESPVGQLSPNVPPTIEHRSLSSTLEMRNGETIVLGGMIQNTTSVNKTATPILGDIPILGALFSSTTKSNDKSELIIYITPHISYGSEFQNASIPSPNQDQ